MRKPTFSDFNLKRIFLVLLYVLFAGSLVLTACQQSGSNNEPDAVAEQAPTETPTNTPVPLPTATDLPPPTATSTPEPTATATATYTPTPEPRFSLQIMDMESGEPVAGITITVSNPTFGILEIVETDADGWAVFENLPASTYIISAAGPGYATDQVEGFVLAGVMEVEYALEPIVMAEIVPDDCPMWAGPGEVYDEVALAAAGDGFEVLSQNDDASWFEVSLTKTTTAWVRAEDVTMVGDSSRLPVVAPPPTPTPAATPTPAPTRPPAPTATPEITDYVTFYYVSNPNEVLGVFPVMAFDPDLMYSRMQLMRNALYRMRDNLSGAESGDAAACSAYVSAYQTILYSGVYFDPVPADWQDLDFAYFISFIYSLDRTRPAYLSCRDAGRVDGFNAGLARTAIADTLSVLEPAIAGTAARLGG